MITRAGSAPTASRAKRRTSAADPTSASPAGSASTPARAPAAPSATAAPSSAGATTPSGAEGSAKRPAERRAGRSARKARTKAPTKDRLLAAARRCLLQRGYAGTTVRDLVAESGANLASINYHFGSKERLLNQALFELNSQWGEVIFAALNGAGGSTVERWQQVIDSIAEHRQLWFVNFEALVLAQHDEEIRAGLAERGEGARVVLARTFAGVTADSSGADVVHRVGSFYYSQLIGVAFQWLTDPASAPSAEEMAGSASTSASTSGSSSA